MIRIPLADQPALPWGYFVLQAARGAVRVPEWVWLAVPAVAAARLGLSDEEAVTAAHLDELLALLPEDPRPVLGRLLVAVELPVPDPEKDRLHLEEAAVRGAFREAVDHRVLLHDAAMLLLLDYGPEAFYACTDAIDDPDTWDARGAVTAMMYLLVLHLG